MGQIIGNLDQVLTALASRSGDIDSLVTNLQTVSSALASKNSLLDDVVGNLSQVATDLASLIGNNHTHHHEHDRQPAGGGGRRPEQPAEPGRQPLARSVPGLAPYIQISQWGQWFAVQTDLHLPGQPDRVRLLRAEQPAGRLGPARQPAPRRRPLSGRRRCHGLPNPDAPSSGPRRPRSAVVAASTPRARTSRPSAGRPARANVARRRATGRRGARSEGRHRTQPQGGRPRRASSSWPAASSAILFLNRSLFSLGLHDRRRVHQRGGHLQGDRGHGGRRQRRLRHLGRGATATPSTPRSRSTTSVQLPHVTTAAIEVETLLGVVDVTLTPVSGWDHPLKPGALITNTSVPTEFYQLQNTAHTLLSKTNAQALNSLVTSLATITKDKQNQVAQIISGLGALTTTVDQRSGQVSQLIDSANTLSTTLASRDQQLLSVINNLNTVSTGLAANDQDLAEPDHQRRRHGQPDQQPGQPGLARAQLAALEPPRRPHRRRPAPGRPGRGRQLPRRRARRASSPSPTAAAPRCRGATSTSTRRRSPTPSASSGPAARSTRSLDRGARARPRCPVTTRPGPLPGRGFERRRRAAAPSPIGLGVVVLHATSSSRPVRASEAGVLVVARRRPGPNSGLGGLSQLLSPLLRGSSDGPAAQRPALQGRPHRHVAAVVLVAGVLVGVEVTKGAPTYPINVVYSSAPGLFTGAAVDVLGVKVGTRHRRAERGRQGARHAGREPGHQDPQPPPSPRWWRPSCSGSPDVDLNPGYTGGPVLPSGATIPEDHTAVPVSTDEVLKELQQHPQRASTRTRWADLVTNLATDLDGQGAEPQQAHRVGGRHGAAAGREGQRPRASSTARWPS